MLCNFTVQGKFYAKELQIMCTVFWDRKGVLLVDFLPQGSTINADVYCNTLKKLRRAIQNKRRGMLSRDVVMIQDNACPHTAAATQNLITTFGWEQFDHPPYSPDLAPSDFHLFLHLKSFLAGQRFHNDAVKEVVTTCFASQAASFYNEGIQKLVQCYDKCLNNGGNYVKK
jgi:histone-lysine N-methyltransferase SETMAR